MFIISLVLSGSTHGNERSKKTSSGHLHCDGNGVVMSFLTMKAATKSHKSIQFENFVHGMDWQTGWI
jgi:hypothetical protein